MYSTNSFILTFYYKTNRESSTHILLIFLTQFLLYFLKFVSCQIGIIFGEGGVIGIHIFFANGIFSPEFNLNPSNNEVANSHNITKNIA